ncbi:MAG TPA: citrate synthase [Chloroflexota bacterium]|nr:citrate synthase [Chloroflexota bacterium]
MASAPSSAAGVAGLEDVVAATSSICFLDGKQGRLLYRGYDIHDLVQHASFEEVLYLLWHEDLPNQAQLDELKAVLTNNRDIPEPVLALLQSLPKTATPMEVLRTTTSALSAYDPDGFRDNSIPANVRKAQRLTAQIPTLTAYIKRVRAGEPLIHPRKTGSIAENLLHMMFGTEPEDLNAKTMNIALILHADHELNASTFAARVTAATLSDMYSSIVSGIGALAGPLHGGANEDVMKMLLRIGDEAKVQSDVKGIFERKEKISGFGHRVYRTEDPRATHLRQMSEELGKRAGELKWFNMSTEIEKLVMQEKHLYCNVDFYSASTYYTMGIPVDLYTPIFACSRISGWTAHVLEQLGNNRLIRPRAEYTGEVDRAYKPIDKR